MKIPKEIYDRLDRSKELTVDELILVLQKYKKNNANGGSHIVNVQAYWGHGNSISGLTVYNINHEDGPYCELYCEDNDRIYGPLFRDCHNGGPMEELYKENGDALWEQ